jgi:hypothetical protein
MISLEKEDYQLVLVKKEKLKRFLEEGTVVFDLGIYMGSLTVALKVMYRKNTTSMLVRIAPSAVRRFNIRDLSSMPKFPKT